VKYDPHTCLTAAELRGMGLTVPDVPDAAWVPRSSVRFGEVKAVEPDTPNPTSVSVEFSVSFTEPFRWVEIDIPIKDAEQYQAVCDVLREEGYDVD